MRKKGSILVTGIALVILLVLGYVADLSVLPQYLKDQTDTVILLGILYGIMFILRMFRVYILLSAHSFTNMPFLTFLPTGLSATTLATYGPLKSGELLAMEMYKQYLSVHRSDSLSVIALSRILDVFIVLGLVFSVLLLLPVSSIRETIVYIGVIILIISIVIALLLNKQLGMRTLSSVSPMFVGKMSRFYETIIDIAERYYSNLDVVNTRKGLILLSILTLPRWILEIIFHFTLFSSFGMDLNILQILPVVGISYAIGVSSGSPGALGTYQLTALTILVIYGHSTGIASLALLTGTALGILVNLFLGFTGLVFTNLQIFVESTQ